MQADMTVSNDEKTDIFLRICAYFENLHCWLRELFSKRVGAKKTNVRRKMEI